MPLNFYPHSDDAQKGGFEDRIETLMNAAERYKSIVLDVSAAKPESGDASAANKLNVPRELAASYNWDEIAILLREIRDMPEGTPADKIKKGNLLAKLADVYEVLRGAKMSKLESVRMTLMSEANQLRGATPG